MVLVQDLSTQLLHKVFCSEDPTTYFKITNHEFSRIFQPIRLLLMKKIINNKYVNKKRLVKLMKLVQICQKKIVKIWICSFEIGCLVSKIVRFFSYICFVNIEGCVITTCFVVPVQFAFFITTGIKEFNIRVQIRRRWSPGQDKSNIRSLKEDKISNLAIQL